MLPYIPAPWILWVIIPIDFHIPSGHWKYWNHQSVEVKWIDYGGLLVCQLCALSARRLRGSVFDTTEGSQKPRLVDDVDEYMGSIWDLWWSYYPLKIVGVIGCGMFLLVRDLRDPNSRRCDVHLWFDISWDDHINRKPCFGIGGSADVWMSWDRQTNYDTTYSWLGYLDSCFFCEALLGVKIPRSAPSCRPQDVLLIFLPDWQGRGGLRLLAVEVWTGHRRRSQRGSGYAAALEFDRIRHFLAWVYWSCWKMLNIEARRWRRISWWLAISCAAILVWKVKWIVRVLPEEEDAFCGAAPLLCSLLFAFLMWSSAANTFTSWGRCDFGGTGDRHISPSIWSGQATATTATTQAAAGCMCWGQIGMHATALCLKRRSLQRHGLQSTSCVYGNGFSELYDQGDGTRTEGRACGVLGVWLLLSWCGHIWTYLVYLV